MYSEYSENNMHDTDSMTSYSSYSPHSSSTPVDGVIFSDSVQEWFQLEQPFQRELENQERVNMYLNSVEEADAYWQQDSNENSHNSNYTYIFDSFTSLQNEQEVNNSSGKTKATKRRRVQTPYQRKAANVRERRRMCSMNQAFDELRKRLPAFDHEKKLSRIETLKLAMTYISFMKDLSKGGDPSDVDLFKRNGKVKDAFLQSVGSCSQ